MSQRSHSLLLLSPPPSPVTSALLSAAYRPALTATFSALKRLLSTTELLVVLPCPTLHGHLQAPRSEIYTEAQKLLGGVYSLIYVVCANLGVDVETETPGSVDSRILLLDHGFSQQYSTDYESGFDPSVAGPIIDLPTLAFTRRKWDIIFSVDGEEGQALLARYTDLANRNSPPLSGRVEIVSGGVSLVQKQPALNQPDQLSASVPHHVVIVGGTFDHLHAGHKLLLTATALLLQPHPSASLPGRRLIVGITGDALLKNKKYAQYLSGWKQRQEYVVDFLLSILSFTRSSSEEAISTQSFDEPVVNGHAIHTKIVACSLTIECVEIQDPFGPTITDESVTALVVSAETRSGGKAVNDKRLEKGWKALEVFEVDVLDAQDVEESSSNAEDFSSKISSTEIRRRLAEAALISSL
ncbi:related to pantetheine-phosphate adenylyltransferase family protein [Phialocephala subalpina]|uniref:Related to pantetheine-phosphate adenylyltransferase family protein n=1 Tax=Phialocephala subalpina TaxID=576137 RepID=A0A1L7WTI2_9HELO|nr:related to pantetheine-phosphate adenylyltransferase family protein [Phialocephala subalpina]